MNHLYLLIWRNCIPLNWPTLIWHTTFFKNIKEILITISKSEKLFYGCLESEFYLPLFLIFIFKMIASHAQIPFINLQWLKMKKVLWMLHLICGYQFYHWTCWLLSFPYICLLVSLAAFTNYKIDILWIKIS